MLEGAILITGGTGTLGNAIVRAALRERWPCSITIYSRSEYRQARMRAQYPELRYILGDIRDEERLTAAVAGHDVVIHAAAMKRLPECEAQAAECVAVNVDGSRNVVRACVAGRVPLCIGISTDKACRASTVYGASKLMLEGLFRSARPGPTRFVLCRYGNVLASNGSVLPIWADQAARGVPLTITDARCSRFWMSEHAAVRVVVRASRLGPGECYIPRMGALNIADMAQILYPGAEMVETGLRSLEKIHEDLIHPDEPALEVDGGFVLSASGTIGHRYSSDMASPIGLVDLRRMIADV